MTVLEKLKQNIHLQSKPEYTETEYFDYLEAAYQWLYADCRAYSPDDSAALANVAAGGGTAGDLDDSLCCLIKEFILWCEDFVTDGQDIGIYDCYNDIDSRSWWVEGLMDRYMAMLDNVKNLNVTLVV